MNKFIQSVKKLDLAAVATLLEKNPDWISWSEENGKNALHYLCGMSAGKDNEKSLAMLRLLLDSGMDMNAIHRIADGCGFFPATPLWYAYAKGRNQRLYTWLLEAGGNPEHCMYAIAWNDDDQTAALFQKHGAVIEKKNTEDTPFLAAFNWKRFKVAEWFLQNGADVNATDPEGNTALHYAVRKKYKTEQIELLLKYGADIHCKNKAGVSPKEMAEMNRQKKILGILNKVTDLT